MRESMMTPKQIEISGRVRKAMVNVGSKSEHTAVLLDADDGHSYELRMPSQNPFEISPHLTDLVGEHLTTSGVASNGTLLMHEWRVSGKGK
jgi:hypothetical protein